jgi:hypothetical protein
MGRTYLFECSRCEYRAKVSGGEDRGFNFFVQTILCRDCRGLYDAVVRVRAPELSGADARKTSLGLRGPKLQRLQTKPDVPPTFSSVLNRLAFPGAKQFRWVEFKVRCPVSGMHRIEPWSEGNKCPRCGSFLDKHPLAFRIWD